MANDQSLRDHTGGPWGALRPDPTLIVSGATSSLPVGQLLDHIV